MTATPLIEAWMKRSAIQEKCQQAWMKRSAIQESMSPGCALLHPGYTSCCSTRATLHAAPPGLLQSEDVVGRHRLEEAFELKVADRFDLDKIFDRGQHPLRDQNLPGLGLAA